MRTIRFYLITVLLALPIAAICIHLAAQTQDGAGLRGAMEAKARKADPQNRRTVRELAHEILVVPHAYTLPQPVATLLEEKLTTAEINFRQGNGRGVTESDLVGLANWIHGRLKLPEHLRTTPAQVRTLRMKLVIASPYTMGDTLEPPQIRRAVQVRSEMSPLQATHLLSVLIDQKVLNPDYQDPTIDLLEVERKRNQLQTHVKPEAQLTTLDEQQSRKRREIRKTINEATSELGTQDAYDIVYHALSTLKLD